MSLKFRKIHRGGGIVLILLVLGGLWKDWTALQEVLIDPNNVVSTTTAISSSSVWTWTTGYSGTGLFQQAMPTENDDALDGASDDEEEEEEVSDDRHGNDAAIESPSLNATVKQQSPHVATNMQFFANATMPPRPISHLDAHTKAQILNRMQADPNWNLLPLWAQEYIVWHAEMRTQYPDEQLVMHPNAPKLLLHTCQSNCGGTHDRLGKLETTLAYASLSHRVVLFVWHSPAPLQAFLQPNLVNWTAPAVPALSSLEYLVDNKIQDFKAGWNKKNHLHIWTQRHGIEKDHKIVYQYRNIPVNGVPQKVMQLTQSGAVGAMFRAFFQPSAAVQAQLNVVYRSTGLQPGHYVATHCRVRHPGFYTTKAQGKEDGSNADQSGLLFEGEYKQKAIQAALRAIQCTEQLLLLDQTINDNSNNSPITSRQDIHKEEPIYFLSDSEDLVEYVVRGKHRHNKTTTTRLDDDAAAMSKLAHTHRLVARNASLFPTLHIDRQKGFPAEYYMDTFVDLYMAVNARCVSFGVGNFGYFASKISGTTCRNVHTKMASAGQARKWNQENGGAPQCRLSTTTTTTDS